MEHSNQENIWIKEKDAYVVESKKKMLPSWETNL